MFCPNKERYLAERKNLKAKIKKFDKKSIPERLSNRLLMINKRLSEIQKIEEITDPANGGLHFTENAIRGD
jgi:acid phosphatase class B